MNLNKLNSAICFLYFIQSVAPLVRTSSNVRRVTLAAVAAKMVATRATKRLRLELCPAFLSCQLTFRLVTKFYTANAAPSSRPLLP